MTGPDAEQEAAGMLGGDPTMRGRDAARVVVPDVDDARRHDHALGRVEQR